MHILCTLVHQGGELAIAHAIIKSYFFLLAGQCYFCLTALATVHAMLFAILLLARECYFF